MDPEALADMLRVGTRSVAAYQAYIHGAALRAQSLVENDAQLMRTAYEFFEEARVQDPDFAAAHDLAADYWVSQLSLTSFQIDTNEFTTPADMLRDFYERNGLAIAKSTNDIDRLAFRAKRADVDLRLREALRLYRAYLDARPNDMIIWEAYLNVATSASDDAAISEAMEVLRAASQTRLDAANYFMDYAYLHLDAKDAADSGLAAMQRWPLQNIIYQTHRSLLFDHRVEEAAMVVREYEQRYPLHPLMEARQACAEGRLQRVRELYEVVYGGEIDVNSGNTTWLVLKMLGEEEDALRVLRNFEFDDVPFIMSAWLSYPSFDPTPFPALMAILERENVERAPTAPLPYACSQP
jgi:hypothetical protein